MEVNGQLHGRFAPGKEPRFSLGGAHICLKKIPFLLGIEPLSTMSAGHFTDWSIPAYLVVAEFHLKQLCAIRKA